MKQIFLYIGNNYVNILLQFVGIEDGKIIGGRPAMKSQP